MATAEPVSDQVKHLPQPLDLPNERSSWEKAKTLACAWSSVFLFVSWLISYRSFLIVGVAFRGLVDFASLPVILARDPNLLKIKIDTGATGMCRLCIYVPKSVDPETDMRTRGVVMHLHGGGWTM